MRKIFTFLFLVSAWIAEGQVSPFVENNQPAKISQFLHPGKYKSYRLDRNVFEKIISDLSSSANKIAAPQMVDLPLADGSFVTFYIHSVEALAPSTAKAFPDLHTFSLRSADGTIQGRLTFSPLGINCLLLTPSGAQYITPADNGNSKDHIVYLGEDVQVPEEIVCGVSAARIDSGPELALKTTTQLGDCQLRTYQIAVAATGEYTTTLTSQTNAAAAIATMVSNISLIYERDLGIRLVLVTSPSIIFTNAATDPYPTASFPTQAILDTNVSVLNAQVGASNYDIGMVVNSGWNGGLAYTPGVCNVSYKGGSAAGITGAPFGPTMEVIAAHEIGHLFSANHTMSAGTGPSCADNLNGATSYEPGGGSTIMAYAGAVCAGMSYQIHSDPYFHYNSVKAIRLYSQSLSCGVISNPGNNAPTLTVPAASYNIPVSTPFELTANGGDMDYSNGLTYTFEQYDTAAGPMTTPPATTNTIGPMFRSFPPSSSAIRQFPSLPYILNNSSSQWEVLPSVGRTMHFKVLVRDNNAGDGCVAEEAVAATTNASAGPFSITSQNVASTYTANGSNTMTVTWNVANTTAAPVSCNAIDIYFSLDNGQNFPYKIASGVPNNGSASVLVPSVNTALGRIKVKAANNIFFDINNAPVVINSACQANGSTIAPSASVSAVQGNAALNLGLNPNFGSVMNISGTLTSTDPNTNLAVSNTSGTGCVQFSNSFKYDLFTFQVNVSGNYTITQSASTPFGTVFNLYENSFDMANPCTNFVTSNAVNGSSSISLNSSLTANLIAGITYVMTVGTFSNSLPTLPANYSFTITAPSGGNIYSGTPNPGTAFGYTYVVVNNTTGNIVAFTPTADLTSYSAGAYTVYGLSYDTASTQTALSTWIGGPFINFQNALLTGSRCANLSNNSVTVNVISPLALSSLNLTAKATSANIVLQWKAVGEEDVQNYSIDRLGEQNNFITIGTTHTTGAGIYQFTDEHPLDNNNTYRVKATMRNGTYVLSNLVTVIFGHTRNEAQIFPNPTTGILTVTLPGNDSYSYEVRELTGKVLLTGNVDGPNLSIDLHSFAPGVYLFSYTNKVEGKTLTNKIIKR